MDVDYKIDIDIPYSLCITTDRLTLSQVTQFVGYITGFKDDCHSYKDDVYFCDLTDDVINKLKEDYLIGTYYYELDGYPTTGYSFYNVYDFSESGMPKSNIVINLLKIFDDDLEKIILEKVYSYSKNNNLNIIDFFLLDNFSLKRIKEYK